MFERKKDKLGLRQIVSGSPHQAEFDQLLRTICDELEATRTRYSDRVKLSSSRAWEGFNKGASTDTTIELALYCQLKRKSAFAAVGVDVWWRLDIVDTIASQLLRKKLPFEERHLVALLREFESTGPTYIDYGGSSLAFLGAVERFTEGRPAAGELRDRLEPIVKKLDRQAADYPLNQAASKVRRRLKLILNPVEADAAPLPKGAWLLKADKSLQAMTEKQRESWRALFAHAVKSKGKSKPSKAWLKQAEPLLKTIGRPRFAKQAADWLNDFTTDPARPDHSLDIVKGLIWATATVHDDAVTMALGRATETALKKVPNVGARSQKLGNAGIVALSMKGADAMAVAELVRLRSKIKYPSVRARILSALDMVARQTGVTVADLEETALPDFGLDGSGRYVEAFGDSTGEIIVTDEGASIVWTGSDGKPRKSVPSAVKRDHADAVKALKQRSKDILSARKTQITRLEDSWIEDRFWTVADWQTRYIDHPLRRGLSEGLIWRIEDGETTSDIMMVNGRLATLKGQEISPTEKATVRLWHPLDSDPDTLLAWRRSILDQEITQPIKQAYREVYVLTDAERTTEIYSNRFAAHVIRQHQFRALCQARGWAFEFLGGWDNWNVPTKVIPARELSAEFHVDAVENDERSEAYVPLYLTTDQIRFRNDAREQLPLETVPPIVFSELLRDVDLFVAVTSVANDPEWTDGGPEGRFAGYWQTHAFGDLSQTASTRRDLLLQVSPKFAIADRLTVTDRFLEVQGNLNRYTIHLGSGNIQILPSNQYLCIVRGRDKTAKLKLPFAGDTTLAIILSKAFMLAEDDKITDKTILAQLPTS
ncbi:MAG: DUF4132 domain-containing protein [Pseudomonadota bacterium]